jgi:hypothetical protein
MLKTFGSKKTLELVIIAQLLGGLGVAYGQTTTSMVTTGNTADTPYTSIVVTQAAGKGSTMADDNVTYFTGVGRAKNAANIMLYMSGDGTLSVKDDGSAIIDGRNNGNTAAVTGIWAETADASRTITVQGKTTIDVEATKAAFTATDANFSYLGLYSYGLQVGDNNTVTLTDGSSIKAQSSFGQANFGVAGYNYPTIELHTYGTYAQAQVMLLGLDEIVAGKVVLGKNTDVTAVSTVGSATITGTTPYLYTEAIGINTPFTAGENLKIDARLETADGAVISGANSSFDEGIMRAAGIHILDSDYSVPDSTEITVRAKAPEFQVKALEATRISAIGIDAFSQVDTQGVTIKTSVDSQYAKNGNKDIAFIAQAVAANDGAQVNINQDGGKKVVLEGDLMAYEGTTINAKLDTDTSYFQGNIAGDGTVNLSLAQGATWRPIYDNRNGYYNVLEDEDLIKTPDYKMTEISTAGSIALNANGIIDLNWVWNLNVELLPLAVGVAL